MTITTSISKVFGIATYRLVLLLCISSHVSITNAFSLSSITTRTKVEISRLSISTTGNSRRNMMLIDLDPVATVTSATSFLTLDSSTDTFISASNGVDLGTLWQSYNDALQENPLVTKSVTASLILGAADLAGQSLEQRTSSSSQVNWLRAARFAFFGLVLQAPWNHFYYLLLDGALPPTPDPFTSTTLIKVIIDQFIQAPIFTVLIFYFLGLLEGKSFENVQNQLDRDYKDTMIANWKLWIPATFVNIAFCPPILRVLFLNCVFFFWSIFLSLKLNNNDSTDSAENEK